MWCIVYKLSKGPSNAFILLSCIPIRQHLVVRIVALKYYGMIARQLGLSFLHLSVLKVSTVITLLLAEKHYPQEIYLNLFICNLTIGNIFSSILFQNNTKTKGPFSKAYSHVLSQLLDGLNLIKQWEVLHKPWNHKSRACIPVLYVRHVGSFQFSHLKTRW